MNLKTDWEWQAWKRAVVSTVWTPWVSRFSPTSTHCKVAGRSAPGSPQASIEQDGNCGFSLRSELKSLA